MAFGRALFGFALYDVWLTVMASVQSWTVRIYDRGLVRVSRMTLPSRVQWEKPFISTILESAGLQSVTNIDVLIKYRRSGKIMGHLEMVGTARVTKPIIETHAQAAQVLHVRQETRASGIPITLFLSIIYHSCHYVKQGKHRNMGAGQFSLKTIT